MKRGLSLAVLTVFSVGWGANAQGEPQLANTTEKLSAAEAKALRHAIASQGLTTASPNYENPYPRILVVPKDVKAAYAKKPKATVRLLLKILEGGEPRASIHAAACLDALVWGPEFGWMATHVDNKTWDDPIAEGRETRREFAYNGCVRRIAEKEKGRAKKGRGSSAVPQDSKALTPSDERYVRQLIYGRDHGTVIPKDGKHAMQEILAVPDQLSKLYAGKPRATLDLLLTIMDGAGPRDSVWAAAYATTLRTNNPVIGAGVLRLFDSAKYDTVDSDWGMPPRQYWIGKVKEGLAVSRPPPDGPRQPEKAPAGPAKPLPQEVTRAWQAAGAKVGWLRADEDGYPQFLAAPAGAAGDLPAFRISAWKEGVVVKLPAPPVAFGLDLFSSGVTDGGLKEVSGLQNLQALCLEGTPVTDVGLQALAGLKNLQSLNLGFTRVTDAGLKEVAGLEHLRALHLYATLVTDVGLKELGGRKNLRRLYLQGLPVTDAGLKELAGLKNLQTLDLSGTRVTDAGLKELAGLKALQTLYLEDTRQVTAAGLQALQKALPGCRIER